MNSIEVVARIVDAEGKAADRLSVTLEVFRLGRGWMPLAQGLTNARGALALKASLQEQGQAFAPALRLVEAGEPAPRVLVEGGFLNYVVVRGRGGRLTVDFGEIERLEETAHARRDRAGRAQAGRHTVAGVPRRGEITQAVMIRALATNNERLVGEVAEREAVLVRSPAARATLELERVGTPPPAVESVRAERLAPEIAALRTSEATLRAQLEARNVEMESVAARARVLESRAAKAEERAELAEREKLRVETESEALRTAAARQRPIGEVAAKIGAEAASANLELARSGGGYRVGKLNVTLRGTLVEDGKIALASAAETGKDPGRFQDLVFDLTPESPVARPAGELAVPDVLGLTESAARRALAAAGLTISVATRPGGAGGRFAVGQAIQQSPAPGAGATSGDAVIVVFAAP
ncbi:MAG: PASTA domain-containing protein [Pseudomonadales bacterium]|jgi:hypothetical protein|nr:PASTA domain-containing protein [Pseudomonadales bacterium]